MSIISVIKNNVLPGPKRYGETDFYIALVDSNPTVGEGLDLPVGSWAMWNINGSSRKFFKIGSTATDWIEEVTVAAGRFSAGSSPYSVIANPAEQVILVETVPMSIVLPAIADAGTITIKDKTGLATAGTPITITPDGAETIDGESSLVLDGAYASTTLVGRDTEWSII